MFENKPIHIVSDSVRLSHDIKGLIDKGLKVYCIAGKHLRTKADLLIAIEDTMELPDYFGRNWDALYDMLTEPEVVLAGGCVLVLDEPEGLIAHSKEDFRVFLEIIVDAWRFWLSEGVVFGLVVRSAEPISITGSYPARITECIVVR